VNLDLATLTGALATLEAKYPEVTKAGSTYAGLADATAKAKYLADYITSGEMGFKARDDLASYFGGDMTKTVIDAKINEADLKAIDDKVTAATFVTYDIDTLTKFGLTTTATKAEIAKKVFMDELVQKKLRYYDNLYHNMTLVQHLQALDVTEGVLEEINLNFDQINLNPDQWNSDVIGTMLFTSRYGEICDINDASCATGWASAKAKAEIVYPLGLTRKTAMAREYSLLEVIQMAENYKYFLTASARTTTNLNQLYHANTKGAEAVKNIYFDGAAPKSVDDLINAGVICYNGAGVTTSLT